MTPEHEHAHDVNVFFGDGEEKTFVGVMTSQVGDGVLRLWTRQPGGPKRIWALPLVGIRMWTRELS